MHKKISAAYHTRIKELKNFLGGTIKIDIKHDKSKFFGFQADCSVREVPFSKFYVVAVSDQPCDSLLRGILEAIID